MKTKHLIALPLACAALCRAVMDASPLDAVRAKMTSLAGDADKIVDAATEGLSAEDLSRVQAIHASIDGLRATEAAMEKQVENKKHLASVPPGQRPELSLQLDGIEGEDAKAVRNFSIRRMILAKYTGDNSALTSDDHHIMAMARREASERGFSLSGSGIPAAAMRSLGFRNDMTATGGSLLEGGNTIRREYQPLITPLADQSILIDLGVTVFDNLKGNLEFPVISTLGTPTTKTETGAADELTATTSIKTMSPRRLPAVVDITNQMLIQDSVGLWDYLMAELNRQFAVVVDSQALYGNGVGANPTGLTLTAGVGAVPIGTNGGPPTWAQAVALETKINVANAAKGKLAYLTSNYGKGALKTVPLVTGQSQMLWEADQINGYPAYATNLISSAGTKGSGTGLTSLIFGNWQDLILGFWGGVQIVTVQDRSQAITGMKSIVMEGFYDILVRRADSFAITTDMKGI